MTRLLGIGLVFLAAATTFAGQADTSKPASKASRGEFHEAEFGQLPLRFNGHVISFADFARIALRAVSERETWVDSNGESQSATRWFLEVVSGSVRADTRAVLPVRNGEVRELLKKDNAEAKEDFLSLADAPRIAGDVRRQAELAFQIEPDKRSAMQVALVDFLNRRAVLERLVLMHRFQEQPSAEYLRFSIQMGREFEKYPLPLLVPPRDAKEGWRTLFRGHYEQLLSKAKEQPLNPLIESLEGIARAYRNKDAAAFNKLVTEYGKQLKELRAAESPFQLKVPAHWIEVGVPVDRQTQFYRDAFAFGTFVSRFYIGRGAEACTAYVIHFNEPTSTVADMFNCWRMDLSMSPLDDRDLHRKLQKIKISGQDALLADMQTPASVPLPRNRTMAAMLKSGKQTWVITMHGPNAPVEREKENFLGLLSSVRLAASDKLELWTHVPPSKVSPEVSQLRVLAAIVPDGRRMWVLWTVSPTESIDAHHAQFLELVKSVKLSKSDDAKADPVSWTLPDTCHELPAEDFTYKSLAFKSKESFLPVYVSAVDKPGEVPLLTLVNHWRRTIKRKPLTKDELPSVANKILVGEVPVVLVDVKPAAGEQTAAKSDVIEKMGIRFKKPAGWRPVMGSGLLTAGYSFVADDQTAKLTVIRLPKAGGKLLPNVNRWRAQIGLDPVAESELAEIVQSIKVDMIPAQLVDLKGPGQSILAVIVPRKDEVWFVKLIGPSGLVKERRQDFQDFVKSVSFR